jgi:hypothetical protein
MNDDSLTSVWPDEGEFDMSPTTKQRGHMASQ